MRTVTQDSCRIWCIAIGLTVLVGCSESPEEARTPLDELKWACFSSGANCEEMVLDALLYLDTANLPSSSGVPNKIVLSSIPTTPISDAADRLEFYFAEDETLDVAIDPGIVREIGWKVRVDHASLEYCDHCGGVRRLLSRGSLANLEFVYDLEDSLVVYARIRNE